MCPAGWVECFQTVDNVATVDDGTRKLINVIHQQSNLVARVNPPSRLIPSFKSSSVNIPPANTAQLHNLTLISNRYKRCLRSAEPHPSICIIPRSITTSWDTFLTGSLQSAKYLGIRKLLDIFGSSAYQKPLIERRAAKFTIMKDMSCPIGLFPSMSLLNPCPRSSRGYHPRQPDFVPPSKTTTSRPSRSNAQSLTSTRIPTITTPCYNFDARNLPRFHHHYINYQIFTPSQNHD